MLLELGSVVEQPGASVSFRHSMHLVDMSFPFGAPFARPVEAEGRVSNAAGLLTLDAQLRTTMSLTCDRCAVDYTEDMRLHVTQRLALSLAGYEDDDILLIRDDKLDLDEALIPLLVLSMETKHLCRKDCLGLCPLCGQSRNDNLCSCAKTPDPRLAPLAAFAAFLESDSSVESK